MSPSSDLNRISLLIVSLGVSVSLFAAPSPEDKSVFSDERRVDSTHFRLSHEVAFAPAGILNNLEGLHAKLLLDLGAFSPWASREPIDIFLYKDAASYAAHTGVHAWASAHYNPQFRSIFGYPSADLTRVLAHELGHLFFTSYFFEKKTVPPLWLNEGVATLMEWDYGLEGEEGAMDRNLSRAGTAPLETFMKSGYSGMSDSREASLWYMQAQSVTRFLMRRFSRAQFFTFCEALRAKKTLDDSLRAAYGFAVPDTAALERLWKESLTAPQ